MDFVGTQLVLVTYLGQQAHKNEMVGIIVIYDM